MKLKKMLTAVLAAGMVASTIGAELPMTQLNTVLAAEDNGTFNSVATTRSYKDVANNNPCITQKYSADPGVMVYNGRVYVYATNDGYLDPNTRYTSENTYAQVNQINVMSSSDMVNWTDHGSINVAGSNGVAKWATNSWAPAATHKTINGKEKFFLYFANGGNGICVLTSDSPTGPWSDPLGRPLISRSTPNCGNVTWLFDPAVFVDSDGTGYIYFGGGVPQGKESHPNTVRVARLGNDMTSIVGTPATIDAPWVFEDSCINKIGNTYYYSYCTNWSGGPYGNARIAYMTSNNPMGPFTYQGTCFNNPGDFFQTAGNNHHTIIDFNNKFYIFYHAEWLGKQANGKQLGYRTTHVDELPFANGRFGNARGTLTGVNQLADVNPYVANQAANMAWQGGINVYGLGQTSVAYNRGDFTGVSNVAFGNTGANSVVIKAGSKNGARIKICTSSQNGTAIGYVDIPATGDNFKFTTVTANIDRTTGTKDLFFVASNDVVIESWQFVNGSQNNQNQNNNQNNNNQNQSNNQNNNNQNQNTNTGYAQMQDGWYYIKNVNAQKYLQVANNSGEKGNNVEISTGNGSLGQKWYLTNKGNNVITLKNGLGCLLDVTNGRNENGINIEIWAENNKNPQNFMLKNAGNNQYGIVTQISNGARGLDAANKGTNDGTNVIQYDFYGGTNQLWTLESTSVNNNNNNQNQPVVDNKNVVMKDGWYYIKNLNAQKYLQVANNQGANGINVEIGAGSGVKGQKWYVTNTSDGYVTLTNGQGFMLDIQYGKADDGTNIQTYSANGADAQKFKISALGNNQYSILTKVSQDSKALDVYNFGTNDGANVCQWTYYKNANQIWYFEPCN